MLKRFFILSSIFFSLALSAAGALHCRSGLIIGAEISTADIKIKDFTGTGFRLPVPERRAYATLTIIPSDLRILSIFDYSLRISGVSFQAVAIWNNNNFEYTTKDVQTKAPVQLLFIIDKQMTIGAKILQITAESNLSKLQHVYSVTVPFTVIGSKMPVPPAKIPVSGMLELPEI